MPKYSVICMVRASHLIGCYKNTYDIKFLKYIDMAGKKVLNLLDI